jgi:hypothetical protein
MICLPSAVDEKHEIEIWEGERASAWLAFRLCFTCYNKQRSGIGTRAWAWHHIMGAIRFGHLRRSI